ncbi:class I SAM-dependent methyltransferase [Lacisediminimonas profundi]|uniref:class I SAM-dependent methyltransferase n=1 Tax=Lacisediminimonas profundi TaxID=2603856 RepID=UPI00124BBF03|nr:class I SAM-dependent methyltransferase [Lacisediminimonas profundi]
MTKSPEEIAIAYRSEPWWYDLRGFFILTFSYRTGLNRMVRFFASNIGKEHLELACGSGTLLMLQLHWRRLHRMPQASGIGIDYAESMLAGAVQRFAKLPEWRFLRGDAGRLQFPDATFDTISIANAIHCLSDVDRCLAEAHRVLKPGGSLAANALLFPTGRRISRAIADRINQWGIRKGILVTPFHRDDIRLRLAMAGFAIDYESVSGNCCYLLARKE